MQLTTTQGLVCCRNSNPLKVGCLSSGNKLPRKLQGLTGCLSTRSSSIGSPLRLTPPEEIGRQKAERNNDRRFFPPWGFSLSAIAGQWGISRGPDNERSSRRTLGALFFRLGCTLRRYGFAGLLVWIAGRRRICIRLQAPLFSQNMGAIPTSCASWTSTTRLWHRILQSVPFTIAIPALPRRLWRKLRLIMAGGPGPRLCHYGCHSISTTALSRRSASHWPWEAPLGRPERLRAEAPERSR